MGGAGRRRGGVGHWDGPRGRDAFEVAYREAFADLPDPALTQNVPTAFGRVRLYRFTGSGERSRPLVLLPGRSSGTPVWADNLPSLLRIADVCALDLLGEAGLSVQERPIRDADDQAAWLDEVLAALPEPSVDLVGLSIGGWTALNLALRRPRRVATLALIEPALTFAGLPLRTLLRTLPAAVPWFPRAWREAFTSYVAGGAPVQDVPVARMIELGMRHYRMHLPQPRRPAESAIAGLDLPVLVILAGASVIHDARVAARVARRALPEAAVHVYPGASHAINGEQPERIAADLAAFLGAQGSPKTE